MNYTKDCIICAITGDKVVSYVIENKVFYYYTNCYGRIISQISIKELETGFFTNPLHPLTFKPLIPVCEMK